MERMKKAKNIIEILLVSLLLISAAYLGFWEKEYPHATFNMIIAMFIVIVSNKLS